MPAPTQPMIAGHAEHEHAHHEIVAEQAEREHGQHQGSGAHHADAGEDGDGLVAAVAGHHETAAQLGGVGRRVGNALADLAQHAHRGALFPLIGIFAANRGRK